MLLSSLPARQSLRRCSHAKRHIRALFVVLSFLLMLLCVVSPLRPNTKADIRWFEKSIRWSDSHPVTIVTAFFPMKSKFPPEKYDQWTRLFFERITGPMVIYTSRSYAVKIRAMRRGFEKTTIIFSGYDDVFDLPPVRNWSAIYTDQLDKEYQYRERKTHSLYAVWATKSWLLTQVIKSNPFDSKYFFWVDAGSFREDHHPYRVWPDPKTIDDELNRSDRHGKVVLGLINPWKRLPIIPEEETTALLEKEDRIQGGFWGGDKEAVLWWAEEFYRLRDKYLRMELFIGKDELIFNAMSILHRDRVLLIQTYKNAPPCGRDPWFDFQNYFASETERVNGCVRTPLLTMSELMKEW